MKRQTKRMATLNQRTHSHAVVEDKIIFHNVLSNENVVKGEFEKDGLKHTVYLLAINEEKISDYSYKDLPDAEMEHAGD